MRLTPSSSVELLAAAQTASGAIPASTVHDVYRYGWLRDGSWCAYALDRAGQTEAVSAWHYWVARTLLAHERRFEEGIAVVRDGRVNGQVMMPARFTLDGQVIRYLLIAGETPCFDCWEEHPGNVHTSSLAAGAAGLRDAGALLGDNDAQSYAAQLIERITGLQHTLADAFVRFPGDTRVDGSLLWLTVPFGLVATDGPTYRNTVTRIRQELVVPDGGVQRYLGDSFYGGSEWILLAATLGWVLHAMHVVLCDELGHLGQR